MGLDKDGARSAIATGRAAYSAPALLAVLALLAAAGGEGARLLLRYERGRIAAGEVWRLATGHIVHLGNSHLVLNLAGLALVAYLVGPALDLRRWLLAILTSAAAISGAFWVFEPRLDWYVGLSGVLHGLLAAGVVAGWDTRHAESWLLAAVLVAKLAWEQLAGPLPGSEAAAGGPVVTVAHLYGTLGGGLAGLAAVRRRGASI